MPTPVTSKLVKPKSEDEFEDLVSDVLSRHWSTSLQRNGRRGQRQHGVDLYAERGGSYFGVQCKNVDGLTISDIRSEVLKAESFTPALACYWIVTSLDRDAVLQNHVRVLSDERSNQGKFTIVPWFWQDIEREIAGHQDLLEKYYRGWIRSPTSKAIGATLLAAGLGTGAYFATHSAQQKPELVNSLVQEGHSVEISSPLSRTKMLRLVQFAGDHRGELDDLISGTKDFGRNNQLSVEANDASAALGKLLRAEVTIPREIEAMCRARLSYYDRVGHILDQGFAPSDQVVPHIAGAFSSFIQYEWPLCRIAGEPNWSRRVLFLAHFFRGNMHQDRVSPEEFLQAEVPSGIKSLAQRLGYPPDRRYVPPGPLGDVLNWSIGFFGASEIVHGDGLRIAKDSWIRRLELDSGDKDMSRGRIRLVLRANWPNQPDLNFMIADDKTIKDTGLLVLISPPLSKITDPSKSLVARTTSGGSLRFNRGADGIVTAVLSRPPLVTVRASIPTTTKDWAPLTAATHVILEWDFTGLNPRRFLVVTVNDRASVEAIPEDDVFGITPHQ